MIQIMKKLFFAAAMAVVLAACSEPYVIVQIADAQLGFSSSERCKEEGVFYDDDVTYENEFLKKAVQLVNEIAPDAVVFTGDQVHHADNQVEWTVFKRTISSIDKRVDVLHLPGNHDVVVWDKYVDIEKFGENAVNLSPFERHFPQTAFCHEEKNVALVGINSNLVKYDDAREGDQFAWLQKVLERNRNKVTLIFGHHPFFLEDIDEGDGYFQIQKSKRKTYFDIFSKYGVDAVYTGHLHDNAEGRYLGIPAKTTTSVAYQIGDAQPSVRVITICKGEVSDEIVPVL